MTFEIALVLGILLCALVLFLTEWVRMDVAALLVLCALAITGLVTPQDAVSGFSNAAVITIWSMFILSEGMTRAGIADFIGRSVSRAGGRSEARVIAVLMMTAGALSGVMNNTGVAALLLPVTIGVARRTGINSARLLMPMAYGALLGGLTTLMGSAPNLLASEALREIGATPFGFFDFTPLGVLILTTSTAFVALFGRHLLPKTNPIDQSRSGQDLRAHYSLQERIFAVRVPADSYLAGRTISGAGISSAAGLIVIALSRGDRTIALPEYSTVIEAGDLLLVQGRLDRFDALRRWSGLVIERDSEMLQALVSEHVRLLEIQIAPAARLSGQTLRDSGFSNTFSSNVLAIFRNDVVKRTHLTEMPLLEGDRLLVQCTRDGVEKVEKSAEFDFVGEVSERDLSDRWHLHERLFVVRVPEDSELSGTTIIESRLANAFDFRLLAVYRNDTLKAMPRPDEVIQGGDLLLVQGREEELDVLRGLQQLQIERDATPYLSVFDYGDLDVVEVVLRPQSRLAGKTIAELNLRDSRQVEIVALWRGGKPHRSNLGMMTLEPGDALLIAGPADKLAALNDDPNIIVLNPVNAPVIDTSKAPVAGGIILLVVVSVLMGWLPISIAAVTGATLMVVTRCLTMEQAYRAIHWRSIFLVAGMLPLGIAMQQTGAADYLATLITETFGRFGPAALIAGLYLVAVLGTLIVPTTALIVLMAPIALSASAGVGISPQAAMMAVAIAVSASFMSPISHPANVLVMGPGGYRFVDYLKLGVPLALVVFVVVAIFLPILWPF